MYFSDLFSGTQHISISLVFQNRDNLNSFFAVLFLLFLVKKYQVQVKSISLILHPHFSNFSSHDIHWET